MARTALQLSPFFVRASLSEQVPRNCSATEAIERRHVHRPERIQAFTDLRIRSAIYNQARDTAQLKETFAERCETDPRCFINKPVIRTKIKCCLFRIKTYILAPGCFPLRSDCASTHRISPRGCDTDAPWTGSPRQLEPHNRQEHDHRQEKPSVYLLRFIPAPGDASRYQTALVAAFASFKPPFV